MQQAPEGAALHKLQANRLGRANGLHKANRIGLMRFTILASAAGAALLLSACQGITPRGQQPVQVAVATPPPAAAPSANAALNGRWVPTDEASRGVYVAEFRDGVFVSRSPGSDDALARGSYTVAGDSVDLNFVGAVSQTEVNATCQRRTATALYCVPTVGSPFNLQRG